MGVIQSAYMPSISRTVWALPSTDPFIDALMDMVKTLDDDSSASTETAVFTTSPKVTAKRPLGGHACDEGGVVHEARTRRPVTPGRRPTGWIEPECLAPA